VTDPSRLRLTCALAAAAAMAWASGLGSAQGSAQGSLTAATAVATAAVAATAVATASAAGIDAQTPIQPATAALPDTRWRHVGPPDPATATPTGTSAAVADPIDTSDPTASAAAPSSSATQGDTVAPTPIIYGPPSPADLAALPLLAAAPTAVPIVALTPDAASSLMPAEPSASPPALSTAQPSQVPPFVREGDFDIPMPWGEPSFEAWRAAYLSDGGKKWLEAMVERGRPWMSFIMEKIYAYDLPSELAWLPMIESEYTSDAVSRSGAVGMWQFMRNSVGGYGIRIDDWVDERRDFMKATDAALRKLADNFQALGSWDLAIAAYNTGLGAVLHAEEKGGNKDFFALRDAGLLSRETSDYVPKFLAIASILRYPARFGLPISWDPPVEWETVEPERSVDLGLLATASGVPLSRLERANSELRYAVTPPWKGYLLKVPEGAAASISAALDDPSKKLLRYTLHTVRSGDSVSAISRNYQTPVQLIVEANPGLQPSRIRIGQVLVIPVLKDGVPPRQPPPSEDSAIPFTGTYVVQKGDSLWSLALRYDVRPETLAERNGLELTSVLREGASLSVPITKP